MEKIRSKNSLKILCITW